MASKPFSYKYNGMDFIKFTPRLKKELLHSVTQFGKRASGKGALGLKRHLERHGDYAPNNPWWHAAKNKKRVFYDSGFWRNSPSFKVIPAAGNILAAVEVGFVNASAHPSDRQSGDMNVQKLATYLTKENKWTPGPKQRKAFWSRIRERGVKINPSEIQPSNEYVSPARDFVSEHLDSIKVKKFFMDQINKGVERALKTTPRKKASG